MKLNEIAGQIAAQALADKKAGTPSSLDELAEVRIVQRLSEIRGAAVEDIRAMIAEAFAPKPAPKKADKAK